MDDAHNPQAAVGDFDPAAHSLIAIVNRLVSGLVAANTPLSTSRIDDVGTIHYRIGETVNVEIPTTWDLSGKTLRVHIETPGGEFVEVNNSVTVSGDANEMATFTPTTIGDKVQLLSFSLRSVNEGNKVLSEGRIDVSYAPLKLT